MAGATGTAPTFGPCSAYATWDDVKACCGGNKVDDDDLDGQDLWLAIATEVVYGITDGKYSGQCVRSFVPCRPGCVSVGVCGCSPKARLDLGPVPVWGAFVTVDDVEIEVSIEDWRYLVREDGLDWPSCTADWFVEYTFGWPVPAGIRMATARLACEYAKQCAGLPCALPATTRSYTREGITVEVSDPGGMIRDRSTGIKFVDDILGNPMHRLGGQLVDLANAGLGGSTSWP